MPDRVHPTSELGMGNTFHFNTIKTISGLRLLTISERISAPAASPIILNGDPGLEKSSRPGVSADDYQQLQWLFCP